MDFRTIGRSSVSPAAAAALLQLYPPPPSHSSGAVALGTTPPSSSQSQLNHQQQQHNLMTSPLHHLHHHHLPPALFYQHHYPTTSPSSSGTVTIVSLSLTNERTNQRTRITGVPWANDFRVVSCRVSKLTVVWHDTMASRCLSVTTQGDFCFQIG